MDIQTAKQIRIADYLYSLGYSPVKRQGVNLWYKSPFREETEASFKVNTEREQWFDFGLGKGGNIIALAAHLYATDNVSYLLKRIEEQTPHVRPVSFSFHKQSFSGPSFQQLEIVPLVSPALLAYLQERGIRLQGAGKSPDSDLPFSGREAEPPKGGIAHYHAAEQTDGSTGKRQEIHLQARLPLLVRYYGITSLYSRGVYIRNIVKRILNQPKPLHFITVPYIYDNLVKWLQTVLHLKRGTGEKKNRFIHITIQNQSIWIYRQQNKSG